MLNMLGGTDIKDKKGDIIDGIEEIFKDADETKFKEYWEKLTKDDCPIIFYYLDLPELKLSDDLYVKMNARGKTLTSFENFKADLIGHIKWEDDKPLQNTIAHKLDTIWTDIFWKNKSLEYKINEIYFAFFNRYFLNSLITTKKDDKGNLLSIDKLEKEDKVFKLLYGNQGNDSNIKYESFDVYKDFGQDILERLTKILDNFYNSFKDKSKDEINNLFLPIWDDENDKKFRFIPEYQDNSMTTLTQPQRVVFHAVCRYFEIIDTDNPYNETTLNQWMRVVWNIMANANINSIQSMIGAIRLIDELGKHSHDIYKFLADTTNTVKSKIAEEQVEEERQKARKILDDNSWELKITDAEKTAFFKGRIRDLFDWNWNDFKVERFEKWDKMCMSGNPSDEVRQALLTRGMNNYPLKNYNFGYNNWNDIIAQNRADFIIFIDDILNGNDCNYMICTYLSDNSKNRMTDIFYHIIKYPYFLEYMKEKTAYKDNGRWIFQQKQNVRVWLITEPYVETMNLFEDLKSKKENGKTNWEIWFWNGERDGKMGVGVADENKSRNGIAIDYFFNGNDYIMQVFHRDKTKITDAAALWSTKLASLAPLPVLSETGRYEITGDYDTIKSYIVTLIS
jgi:hypothetical protein